MSGLFKWEEFVGAGGILLSWKIECEALSGEDWDTIARIAAPYLPPFRSAYPVPRGGNRLAWAFRTYATPGAQSALVVDDVWTTGKSMRNFVGARDLDPWHGFVAFARGPLDPNVRCFLQVSLSQHPGGGR